MNLFGAIVCVYLAPSCTGAIGDSVESGSRGTGGATGVDNSPRTTSEALPTKELAATIGIRRLTTDEYDNTLRDLIGDTTRRSHLVLPEDVRNPFDNDYTKQQVGSQALVEGAELLAADASTLLQAGVARRDQVVGCKPAEPNDAGCFRQFITRFGRRALRRPLTDADIERYVGLLSIAKAEGDFYAAVDAAVRTFLQDPEFLYRIEIGTPVAGAPGLYNLGPFELASRLSYFLWGSMPDDGLLDRAQNGGLATPADVRAAAAQMLGTASARDRIDRFHAMWMGYEELPHSASLSAAMKDETTALVNRVIFDDKKPWQDLFRSDQTYVNNLLANHYKLTAAPAALQADPQAHAWVPYTGTKRRGLLSQGSFLSLAGTDDEVLMTIRRGKRIRETLLCAVVAPKPNNVRAPSTRPKSSCKVDVLENHRQGGCAGCHAAMDPVGFGLDSYDSQGKYRTSMTMPDQDTGKPISCPVRADGQLEGNEFNGPAELADLVLGSAEINPCAIKQLYRFMVGRHELDQTDQNFIDLVLGRIGQKDFQFDQLLLDFVSADAFAHRRGER